MANTTIWEEKTALVDSVEVAIIGGGIAGVSVALHLAERGVDVALFEEQTIGSRASGHNDGQILVGLGEHYNRIVSQFGIDNARQLREFVHLNNTKLRKVLEFAPDASMINVGGLHMAETDQELKELIESADLLSLDDVSCRLISARELQDMLPVKGFRGALYLPQEATVNPLGMTESIARLAQTTNSGAKIYEHHSVVDVAQTSDGYTLSFHNTSKQVRAIMVVHCTSALARDLDKSGFIRKSIFPYRGQIIATNEVDPALVQPFHGFAMSSNFCYEYFRAYNNRLAVGGMRWSVKGQEENTIYEQLNRKISQNLYDYVDKHLPTFSAIDFPIQWTGIMAGTNDGLPLVGEMPGQPGCYVFMAFNGYGLSFAFHGAKIISDYIVDGRSDVIAAQMFNPKRFSL